MGEINSLLILMEKRLVVEKSCFIFDLLKSSVFTYWIGVYVISVVLSRLVRGTELNVVIYEMS